jgi:MFS family permease
MAAGSWVSVLSPVYHPERPGSVRIRPKGRSTGREWQISGLATALFTLPFVVFAAPAGWLADRFSKRSVVIAAANWRTWGRPARSARSSAACRMSESCSSARGASGGAASVGRAAGGSELASLRIIVTGAEKCPPRVYEELGGPAIAPADT